MLEDLESEELHDGWQSPKVDDEGELTGSGTFSEMAWPIAVRRIVNRTPMAVKTELLT